MYMNLPPCKKKRNIAPTPHETMKLCLLIGIGSFPLSTGKHKNPPAPTHHDLEVHDNFDRMEV
jgi:hypothetical protein